VPPTGRTIEEHDPLLFAEVQRVRDQCAVRRRVRPVRHGRGAAAGRGHFRGFGRTSAAGWPPPTRWPSATCSTCRRSSTPTPAGTCRPRPICSPTPARRCTTPTLRGRHEGRRPVAVDWLRQSETDTEAYLVAADFVRREIRCLEWLLDAPALPLDQPAWTQVAEVQPAGKTALDRL